MAFQPEVSTFDAGVFQLETATPVQGGVGGASNSPLLALSNRTKYLKDHVDALEAAAAGNAPINSPTFTGDPKVPTAASGDNDTSAASTAFVKNAASGISSINCAGGVNVNVSAADAGRAILRLVGVITANIAVIVPTSADKWVVQNDTTGPFTITVKTAAGTGVVVPQGHGFSLFCDGTNVKQAGNSQDFLLRSGGQMTGNVELTTGSTLAASAAQFDNSTKLATTAFVKAAGLQTAGAVSLVASTVLDASHIGKANLVAAAGSTMTLPLTSAVPSGSVIVLANSMSGSSFTVQRAGAEFIALGGTNVTSMLIAGGDTLTLVSSAGSWHVVGGSAGFGNFGSFSAASSAAGYQKLPSGIIIQWGNGTSSSVGNVTVNFPLAFPNAVRQLVVSPNAAGAPRTVTYANVGNSNFTAEMWTTQTSVRVAEPFSYLVVGY